MTAAEVDAYRRRLEDRAGAIRAALAAAPLGVTAVSPDPAIGRLTRMDAIQAEEMAEALRRHQSQELMRIDRALKAIANGRYGVCAKCGDEMSRARLDAQPDAVLCVDCSAASDASRSR